MITKFGKQVHLQDLTQLRIINEVLVTSRHFYIYSSFYLYFLKILKNFLKLGFYPFLLTFYTFFYFCIYAVFSEAK